VDATAAKSADSEQPAKKPSESPATTSGAPASSGAVASSEPVPAGSIHSATASASRVQQQPEPVASVPSEVPVLPESQPKQPTLELLAAVKIGVKEDELASLGPAASRVTIPDEGHLREILTYSVNGQRLGTIRLDNGEVVSVQPAVSKDVTP